MQNPNDVLMMRIAQDCYLAAGSSENVLSCVTRYPQTSDQHHLHGSVLGMLATGYLENGRFTEAEEAAAAAVDCTRVKM